MDKLKNVWSVFQNLGEFVYASDIETNELVYLNRKAMDTFGLKSIDEIKGRKCYEVLQGSNLPCALCTNNQLSVGNYVEWSYYNHVIDRHLMVKDTMVEDPDTGKKYRIGITIDVTGHTTKETAQDDILKIYQKMEMLVNKGMKEAISAEAPDESIDIIWSIWERLSVVSEPTYLNKIKMVVMTTPMSGVHRAFTRRRRTCKTCHRRSVPNGIAALMRARIS